VGCDTRAVYRVVPALYCIVQLQVLSPFGESL